MAYEIKPALWGFKPGKKETRQPIITGSIAALVNGEYWPTPPYFSYTFKRQVIDSVSQTFISPNMQARDFKPFAKELIDTGTVVLDAGKGRMFMWNLPLFSFEISQAARWTGRCQNLGMALYITAAGYSVLLTPYIYLTGDICRLSLNKDEMGRLLYFRLSYVCLKWETTFTSLLKLFCATNDRGGYGSNDYFSLQQSINTSDWSATNCIQGLTLSQLLGVEIWGDNKNGFFIQYGGGSLYSALSTDKTTYQYLVRYNIFKEGTTSIRARVFLPELFAPVADQPAILTTSAPIISGCIVRFVKNKV